MRFALASAPRTEMSSRLRSRLLGLALGACAATAVFVPSQAQAAPPTEGEVTAEELLEEFAKMPGLYAEFKEEKHMALLAAPLVSKGTLHFSRDRLARHTTSPLRSSLVIQGNRIDFGDEQGHDSIDFSQNQVVKLFVESFTKILAGDRAALERIYKIDFEPMGEPGERAWKLTLKPKVEPMTKYIDRLEVEGKGLSFSVMRMYEVGGDRTDTIFTKVDTKHTYEGLEERQVFSVMGT